MINTPLISVIVPCYKVEQYLSKCIDSILRQTYCNLEIWLVDDGSPDRCGQICDEYAAIDNRIKVIHKTNGGLSDARNVAIDLATGEWITFVDSDDYVTEDYVETLYSLVAKYHCMMAVADWQILPLGSNVAIENKKTVEIFFSSRGALEDMFNQRHFDTSACAKLYHRDLFRDIRYPKGMLFEDLLTTFKLMLRCENGIAYSNRKIYYYMFRPSSIEGSSFSEKKMDSAIEVFNVMKSYEIELADVSRALKSKLSAFSFHLLLKMPNDYDKGAILMEYIKKVRWTVVCNYKARMKTRLGCLCSYFGFRITKLLFIIVDRRK